MDINLNASAQKEFDSTLISEIAPDESYPVRMHTDPFGRTYFAVGNFCGMDRRIKEDSDLSWLEWDGNEVYIPGTDKDLLFKKTVGILKGWREQLVKEHPAERFTVFASYDGGENLAEECERSLSFTLRLWKIREGQGPDENMDFDQPVIRWSN
jgi:hypothetical protein